MGKYQQYQQIGTYRKEISKGRFEAQGSGYGHIVNTSTGVGSNKKLGTMATPAQK